MLTKAEESRRATLRAIKKRKVDFLYKEIHKKIDEASLNERFFIEGYTSNFKTIVGNRYVSCRCPKDVADYLQTILEMEGYTLQTWRPSVLDEEDYRYRISW